MGTLRTDLERIASSFVSSVLAAMRTASLSDLADQTGSPARGASPASSGRPRGRPRGSRPAVAVATPAEPRRGAAGRGGRRRRASPDEVAKQKDSALAAAKTLKPGFSKGDVMSKSGARTDL